jgi:hypothetical protein
MTILGFHTADELNQWIAALDYQIGQIDAAFRAAQAAWIAKDNPTAFDWRVDWTALQNRYGAARLAATTAQDAAAPRVGFEPEWQAVHRAIVQVDGAQTKGDLQDLYARLQSAPLAKPVDFSHTPQPTAPDADLIAFNAAGQALDAVKTTATNPALFIAAGVGLGLLLVLAVRR